MEKSLPVLFFLTVASGVCVARSGDRASPPPPAVAPFNATQAMQYQGAWAKHLGQSLEVTNSIGVKLRLVPPGEFQMGSSTDEARVWHRWYEENELRLSNADEFPRHRVRITRPFYLTPATLAWRSSATSCK